ncbi:hypothetical protein NW762_008979 [Fusarium torreyae]|uniref:Uncharacterized protein n=1 Tax=Fusarium torreyae TaxID=1237075 RepID=A0A9W8RUX9_9HYPO|nr:hypothetical protein NW762_008979 [Fusarium torreyae]
MFLTEYTEPEDWPEGSKLRERRNSDGSIPAEILDEILDEIITISERDGAVWERYVCVTDEASETFVSPPCDVDDVGRVYVEGWTRRLTTREDRMLLIHPVCLAFVCRHNGITPKQLWETFHAEGSRYQYYKDEPTALIHCVDYFENKMRSGQAFEYHFDEVYPGEEDSPNPETIKEIEWLLARPTYLPAPQKRKLITMQGPSSRAGGKVLVIPELLDNILEHIVDVPANVIESELKESHQTFEAPSAVTAAKTLLSMAQVNRSFYQAVSNRQDLFFTAIQNFGWMLPFSSADWADSEWPDTVLEDRAISRGSNIDWRGYMLRCVNKPTPHLRNRWRLHKMAVQFARGGNGHRFEKDRTCFWNAGSLALKPDLQKPEAQGWEVGVEWW